MIFYCSQRLGESAISSLENCTPTSSRSSINVGSLLGQRRRRWPNSEPTLVSCLLGYVCYLRLHNNAGDIFSSDEDMYVDSSRRMRETTRHFDHRFK